MMLAGSTRTLGRAAGSRLLAAPLPTSGSGSPLRRAPSSSGPGAPASHAPHRLLGASSRRCIAARASSSSADDGQKSGSSNGNGAGAAAPSAPAAASGRRPRVLSGVQPTGRLHLGNYLGAIRNWVGLQDTHDAFFCVVDLHAVTSPHDPRELREATRAMAAAYIAAGVDPRKAHIFVQSHVPAHAELAWLLECVTPVGWLGRMTQFKDKSRKMQQRQQQQEEQEAAAGGGSGSGSAGGGSAGSGSAGASAENASVGTGLMTYPVLMAADILLYQADLVPVGEDQKQHLELARDLATRVNSQFGGKGWKKRGGRGGRLLTVPEPMIPPAGARVMSLLDGTAKMSKSADNDASRINLTDPPEVIAAKIRRCKTDSFEGIVASDPKNRPEAANLLAIYALCTGQTVAQAEAECASLRWGDFKPRLADAVVAHLEPFQRRYGELMGTGAGGKKGGGSSSSSGDWALLDGVLAEGAEAAAAVADATLFDVRDAMGFVAPRRDLVRRVPRQQQQQPKQEAKQEQQPKQQQQQPQEEAKAPAAAAAV